MADRIVVLSSGAYVPSGPKHIFGPEVDGIPLPLNPIGSDEDGDIAVVDIRLPVSSMDGDRRAQ